MLLCKSEYFRFGVMTNKAIKAEDTLSFAEIFLGNLQFDYFTILIFIYIPSGGGKQLFIENS